VISYKEDTVVVPWQFWHMSNFHFAQDIFSWKEPCEAPPLKDSKNTSHIIIILQFWCHLIEILTYPSATVWHGRGPHRTIFLHTLLSTYLGSPLLCIVSGHQIFFLFLCSHMVSNSSSLFMSMSNLI
jgi:hypothetical protein